MHAVIRDTTMHGEDIHKPNATRCQTKIQINTFPCSIDDVRNILYLCKRV